VSPKLFREEKGIYAILIVGATGKQLRGPGPHFMRMARCRLDAASRAAGSRAIPAASGGLIAKIRSAPQPRQWYHCSLARGLVRAGYKFHIRPSTRSSLIQSSWSRLVPDWKAMRCEVGARERRSHNSSGSAGCIGRWMHAF